MAEIQDLRTQSSQKEPEKVLPKHPPIETILPQIRLIATDMDGTLTHNEEFRHPLFMALERLQAAERPVMITTGRSAGWVSGLAHLLPVVGAMAENGGVYFNKPDGTPIILQVDDDIQIHRQKLKAQFERLREQLPQLEESTDNRFRLTDWTFEVEGLSPSQLAWITENCREQDWGFTYSTVQCHIKPLTQDKATGLTRVMQQQFPTLTAEQVLTIGDSPNDESMFDASQFPYSVGVANVRRYLDQFLHKPTWIMQKEAGEGFCELAERLLKIEK